MERGPVPAGGARAPWITCVVLLGIGALVFASSAASRGFDLGEDLELGRAVHDAAYGPAWAALGAGVLAVLAVLALLVPLRAGRLAIRVAIAAPAVTSLWLLVLRLWDVDRFHDSGGLGMLAFVTFFFALPTLALGGGLVAVTRSPPAPGPRKDASRRP